MIVKKRLIYQGFFAKGDAEDLRDFVGRLLEVKVMLEAMDQQQHDHRDPQLSLDRVGRGPKERLDVQVLLHPFEQQLDPPSLSIQQCDLSGRAVKVVTEEGQ